MVTSVSANNSSPITFSGLASGVNTDDIVAKLMAVERLPVDQLTAKKTEETNRLKAYGSLNTLLGALKDSVSAMNLSSNVRTTKASLSSESAFTATSNNAFTGSYEIAVTQLAQVQKTISNGYASKTASNFGTGTITVNGTAITIDSTNNSLQGLMTAINAVSATTGVSASIINDGSATPYRLSLTGADASKTFTVTNDLQGSLTTTTVQNAQQAKVTIDGIEVVSNSNTITDAISGVTLNLNATSPIASAGPPVVYTTTKMAIVADTTALKDKITAFVSSYNKIMNWITAGYAKDIPAIGTTTSSTTDSTSSDTPTDAQLSQILRGDSTVNTIKRGLQSILTTTVNTSGSLHILSDIGISTNKDGTLNLNNSTLTTALQNNFDGVTKLLAGENAIPGVMGNFNTNLISVTSATQGMYAKQRTSYTSKVNSLDDQIAQKTALLDKTQATMRARFTAMESLVSTLNAQSSYLTQLSNLSKSSNS